MTRAAALRLQAEGHELVARGLRAEADAIDAEAAPAATLLYVRASAYAERVNMSLRTIRTFMAAGMPTVGSGRGRRIVVASADAWLAEHRDRVDDAIEQQARAAASRAASRAR